MIERWVNISIIALNLSIFIADCEKLVKEADAVSYDESHGKEHESGESETEVDCIHFNTFDDTITCTESLEVDVIYSAPPLNDLYRYHIFFSHSNEDKTWVSKTTQRLESEPYCYKCYYDDSMTESRGNKEQTRLCAAMLSERVVIVLSQSYMKHKWLEFQKQLQNLTECSLYRQRMLVVLLKDCVVPDTLQPMGFLDARESDFFPCFVRHLRSDIQNGQLLTSLGFCIKGRWSAHITNIDDDDNVPTPLCCHGINMSYSNFIDIVKRMQSVADSKTTVLSFLFSLKPIVILVIVITIWLSAFVFVVLFFMDESKQSALGVRLFIFSLPLLFVFYGYVVRWKRQQFRQKICVGMIDECVHVNEEFAASEKPLLLTTTMSKSGIFYQDVEMLLANYLEEDLIKFEDLIEIYTGAHDYLQQRSLAERLTVMVSTIYLHRMLMNQLPSYAQERHTSHKFCLCQFVEQLVEDFYQCLSKDTLVKDLQTVLEGRLSFHKSLRDLKKYQKGLAIHDEFSFTSI
ncbi:hypothetical protein FSP39_006594 [Pinctada imbricata]|uniref:TIR domain-containing protein n=1 Tax=Pinctada imbricata TaxID=66713 RepID=A0AA88XZ57_PINIB|nr:hypothetical protein FSP39_006594 [Pinctada imbricata]